MALALTEEQRQIKQIAEDFFKSKAPVRALRTLRDTHDADGFSRALWQEMAALGWTGIAIAEEYGGSDFGHIGLGLILEAAGRTLAATPLISTVLLGAGAVQLAGNAAQRQAILPAVVEGKLLLALALEEKAHHAPTAIATKATRTANGYRLDGQKVFVLDGHIADTLIVAARTSGQPDASGGITLFLVDGKAPGVSRTRTTMVDSRNAARIRFTGVELGNDAVLGPVDGGGAVLEQVLDRGRIGLAAEMLGSALEAFERTVAYLKDRKQFGVAIGSFQALKHRAAEMFCEVELSKSAVLEALSAIDEHRNDIAVMASVAKAKLCDTFFLVSNEGVQMHGGIGMTDEAEIGFFMKRARVAQATFGDAAYHRDRFARLEGF
jgi:alkylation response protein AidB-like acyl-CoA dehydrogenase